MLYYLPLANSRKFIQGFLFIFVFLFCGFPQYTEAANNTAPIFSAYDNKVVTDFSDRSDYGQSVILQPDGKILVVGRAAHGSTFDFALARYLADGSLDTSFGVDGKVFTDFSVSQDYGQSVTLQPDGKILVAGYASNGSNYDFALARYLADGSLDTSFDVDGKVVTDFSNANECAYSVTLQPDGKILVAGYASSNGSNSDFALARYLADGSLDTSFGVDGKVVTDFSNTNECAYSVTLQPDGKILVAGRSSNGYNDDDNFFALARYLADGSLDTSFGVDGKVVTDFSDGNDQGNSVILQPDGKILVAGYASNGSNYDFALARYHTDGSIDTSFGINGKVVTDFSGGQDFGQSVTLQPNGKILVAGSAPNGSNYDFALARYHTGGSLDTSFGIDGKVLTDFSSGNDYGNSVTLQPDGKILVAGQTYNGRDNDFALARYLADGSFDYTLHLIELTLDSNITIFEQTVATLDSDVQVYDVELYVLGNYAGATLNLFRHGGANFEDVFSTRSGGSLSAMTQGLDFSVNDITIGQVITNSGGRLSLLFNTNATQALVDLAMQQISYQNTSDDSPATVQIDWTFNDGNTGDQGDGGALSVTGSTTVNISAVNDSPRLTIPLVDQSASVSVSFSYTVPENSFTDPDDSTLTYSIVMADGTGVPPWLGFDSATRTLSGTPSTFDIGNLDIRVTATDSSGATASDIFRLTTTDPDSDSDGVSDSTDAFPTDPAASVDTDGDGYPDNWNDGYTQADSTTGLTLDAYPNDETKHMVVASYNDLNADGTSDVLLRNTTNGQWRMFTMGNMIPTSQSVVVLWANQNWVYQEMADYDADGDTDVLMRNSTDGNWRLFTVQDGSIISNTTPNLWRNQNYIYQTSADFDADGDADILLRDTTTGFYRLFTVEDGAITGSVTLSTLWRNTIWNFAGAADFDNDGDADILLRNSTTGEWRLFIVQNGNVTGSHGFNLWKNLNWTLQGLADYDKDGDADVLMRDINGYWQIFEVQDGQTISNNVLSVWANPAWVTQSAQHDLDGDGDADILLRSANTGLWWSFTMEGLHIISNGQPFIWANQDWEMQ